MNIFKYKTIKEEYIRILKLKIKSRTFKYKKFFIKIGVILLILLELLNLTIFNFLKFNIGILLGILTIILGLIIINEKTLITIKLLKYNILEKLNKLERKVIWNGDNFKMYNNNKLIINSYSEIKNLIENDKSFIINYEANYEKKFNVIVPKNELYKERLLNEFKNDIINKIGEENYKNLNIKLEKYDVTKWDYIRVFIAYIIAIIIILYFINIFL